MSRELTTTILICLGFTLPEYASRLASDGKHVASIAVSCVIGVIANILAHRIERK